MKNNKKTRILVGAAALLCLIIAGIMVLMLNSDGRRLNHQLQLGEKYLEDMDYEQAVVAFNIAIEIDPANVDAYLGLAEAYFRLGEYGESLACIDRLLELDAGNTQGKAILTDCLNEYIKVLAKEERYDEIKALAEKYGSIAVDVDFQSALANAPVQVEIFMTDIEADHVFNMDGYGCLTIDGVGSLRDDAVWDPGLNQWDTSGIIPPQKAVMDREGNLLFPYMSTYLTYRISDGIVSLTDTNAYKLTDEYSLEENQPQYYHLDGSSVFMPEYTTNDLEEPVIGDRVYDRVTETSYWCGSPMKDGYALVINRIFWSFGIGFAGGVDWEYHSYIIDQTGTIVHTLPEEFNNEIAFGSGGFDTEYGLGWCGEGLFAVIENGYDEDWNYSSEAKGYMDFSGNMALDLSGRGFTNLWPFHEGLAAVRSEDNGIGFIDKSGELVIPCIYEDFGDSFGADGICAVQKDGKWGYIDRNNNVVIPFEYDGAYGADAGLATVVKDGKCGLVDYQNRIVIDLEYDDISSPGGGAAYAIKDRTLYIITVK